MKSLTQVASNLHSGMAKPQPTQLNAEAAYNINDVFKALEATFPAFKHAFSTDEKLAYGKKVWTKALIENGITSTDQISTGMRKARACESDFVPSVGKFISWCSPSVEDIGLDLASVVNEIANYQKRFKDDEFTFSHRVIELVNAHVGYEIRKVSAERFAKIVSGELNKWIKHLANGGQLPDMHLAIEFDGSPSKCLADQVGYQVISGPAKALLDRVRGKRNDS